MSSVTFTLMEHHVIAWCQRGLGHWWSSESTMVSCERLLCMPPGPGHKRNHKGGHCPPLLAWQGSNLLPKGGGNAFTPMLELPALPMAFHRGRSHKPAPPLLGLKLPLTYSVGDSLGLGRRKTRNVCSMQVEDVVTPEGSPESCSPWG